jgi:hypothetical protein
MDRCGGFLGALNCLGGIPLEFLLFLAGLVCRRRGEVTFFLKIFQEPLGQETHPRAAPDVAKTPCPGKVLEGPAAVGPFEEGFGLLQIKKVRGHSWPSYVR